MKTLVFLLFLSMSLLSEVALSCSDSDVRYAKSSDRIYVESGGACTLTDISSIVVSKYSSVDKNQLLEELSPGVWFLKTEIQITDGSTLNLRGIGIGGDVDELRLLSENGSTPRHIKIQAKHGRIDVRDTRITSWDPLAQGPDRISTNGRAYLHVNSFEVKGVAHESRMDILNSEVSYLGYSAAESYGLVWKVRGGDKDATIYDRVEVYGDVKNSFIHHNYMGIYSFGAYGMLISDNEIAHNESYGIDPHDDSDNIVVNNNDVHDNGNHGIICSRRCSGFVVTNNDSYRNKHGIMLHRDTNDSLVENNNVYDNADNGIAVFESHRNTIRGNIVRGNKHGIRLSLGSHDNLVDNNLIEDNDRNGIYQYMGSDKPETTNGRPAKNSFLANTVINNGRLIKLRDSDDILMEGNVFQGMTDVEIHDSTGIKLLDNNHFLTEFEVKANGSNGLIIELDENARVHLDDSSSLELRSSQGRVLDPQERVGVIKITSVGSSLTLDTSIIGTASNITALPLWVTLTGGEIELSNASFNAGLSAWSVRASTNTPGVGFRVGELSPNVPYMVWKNNALWGFVTTDSGGEARFSDTVDSDGAEYKLLSGNESLSIGAAADSYVRDGIYSNINFGKTRKLDIKSSGVGYNREAYFLFELTGIPSVASARVHFFMGLSRAGSVNMELHMTSGDWVEEALTWNSKPATIQLLDTFMVNEEGFSYYDIDVTDFIRAELNQGATAVGFSLKSAGRGAAITRVYAREGMPDQAPFMEIRP